MDQKKAEPANAQRVNIQVDATMIGGVYSNNMQISHSREEFVMDFFSILPPTGKLSARVVVTPGHIKRIVRALQENLERYEKTFGTIPETQAPAKPEFVH